MGLKVVEERLSRLRFFERNPRSISLERLEALKRSLVADREMLWVRPLIALLDRRVICGNMRLLAARELKWVTIPVAYVDLDEGRARLWVLRDNNGYGEWDDTLPAFLAEMAADGVDLDLSGLAPEDLEQFIREASRSPRDPDEAPPAPAVPRSKPGEVYELGPHRLVCGDATDPDVVETLTAGERASAVWTDPPYGVEYVGKTSQALRLVNDSPDATLALLTDAFVSVGGVLEPGAPFYVASPAGPMGSVFRGALETAGWRLHQCLVWVKDALVLGHSDYHYRHEDILFGHLPGGGRPGRGRHQGSRWRGDNAQDTVFEVARPKRSETHPTIKPVELITAQLRNSIRPGEVVLDPFAGSGSTLIAAETLGARAFLVEIDPRYADVCRQRYADYVGRPELAP